MSTFQPESGQGQSVISVGDLIKISKSEESVKKRFAINSFIRQKNVLTKKAQLPNGNYLELTD